jgi:TRAP-type C4-dicarboxylate transport system permease small subunit
MLSRIDKAVSRIEMTAAGFIVALICSIVFLQVLFRYAIHSPLAWTEELARYLQVWLTMIGAAIGVHLGIHFRLDIIHLIIPKEVIRYYRLIILLATLLFIGMLVYYGADMLETVQRQRSPAMHISMFYPYLAIPVGAGLMAFHVIIGALQILGGEEPMAGEESR